MASASHRLTENSSLSAEAKWLLVGDPSEWGIKPDANQYIRGSDNTRALMEAKQLVAAQALDYESSLERLRSENQALELAKDQLIVQVQGHRNHLLAGFILSLVAAGASAIGAYLLTDPSNPTAAWPLIGIAVCVELAIFLLWLGRDE